MDNSQSFTARRSATSSLPNFQLPPPDHLSSKYSSYAPQLHIPQSNPQGIGSVLTPPVGLGGDGISPVSSGVNSGSSGSSLNGVPAPYNPQGFWPPPNQTTTPYSFSSGPPMPAPFAQNPNTMYSGRGLYSPNTNSYTASQRDPSASTSQESLPQPPYQLNLPPFPTGSSSGGQGSSSLPNLSQQQQQNQQPQPPQQNMQQQQQQSAQQQDMHNSPQNFGPRPPPTPTYSYGSGSTLQQSAFSAFSQPSPTQQSPITSGGPSNRISPISANHPNTMQPPPGSGSMYRPQYNGYNLPGLSGQLMQNSLHSPNGQMMVGQIPMQGYPHPGMQHQMYGMNPGPGAAHPNDKPCKCDQCPTSFNRNHDLKRHKRIHMTIKPFPCEDCEKRFSRKDALKVRCSQDC